MSPGEVMSNCYSVLLGAVVTTPHSPNYMMSEHLELAYHGIVAFLDTVSAA